MRLLPPLLNIALALLFAASAHAGIITAGQGRFYEDGIPFRFIGFNTPGISHFGHGDIRQYAPASDRTMTLDLVQGVGGRVIRIFCPYSNINATATGDRLLALLNQCQDRDIYVIIALTDFFRTGFNPMGDSVFYFNAGTYWILGNGFFNNGYKTNYLPQSLYLAERFKNHPAIFAWEVGNELRDDSNRTGFVNFCLDVAAQLRAADPNHLITTGIQGTSILGISNSEKMRLYSGFDFVTTHNYNGGDYENDTALANNLNKPLLIEEAGMSGADRPARTHADIAKWMNRGADGYMQWGIMAPARDNGDGDRTFGVDRVFHAEDWDAYLTLFTQWSAALAAERPTPVPSPTPVATPTPDFQGPAMMVR